MMIRQTVRFHFDRNEDGAAELNKILAARKLSMAELNEDFQGFLVKRTKFGPDDEIRSVEYRYGLQEGTLYLEETPEEETFLWQIETAVIPRERMQDPTSDGADEFHDAWVEQHPDRFMRSLSCIAFEKAIAYVVLFTN